MKTDDDDAITILEPRAIPATDADAVVVLQWRDDLGRLVAYWPAFNLSSSFGTWAEAIEAVFYPGVNDHVRMRVR